MSKKWLAAAALLIICCCATYQLLRETPTRPNEAGDIPRIENPAPAGGKMGAGDAGSENRREVAAESAAPGLENTISGRVIAMGNGNPAEARAALPVSGAVISLLNNPRVTTTTDDNGSFRLSPVAARASDLLIRAAGYGVAPRLRVPPGIEGLVIRMDKALTLRGKTSFADGRGNACACRDVDGTLELGNIHEQPLAKILSPQNPRYMDLIERQQNGNFDAVCRSCTAYQSIYGLQNPFAPRRKRVTLEQFMKRIDD